MTDSLRQANAPSDELLAIIADKFNSGGSLADGLAAAHDAGHIVYREEYERARGGDPLTEHDCEAIRNCVEAVARDGREPQRYRDWYLETLDHWDAWRERVARQTMAALITDADSERR